MDLKLLYVLCSSEEFGGVINRGLIVFLCLKNY